MNSHETFGSYLKELRLQTGLTLREFCLKHGLDPGNMSRLERGLTPPPQARAKLEEYATRLGLKRDSDAWYRVFDLAAAERGRIPDDILADEAILAKLPLLFRTLRGQSAPEQQWGDFIPHNDGPG